MGQQMSSLPSSCAASRVRPRISDRAHRPTERVPCTIMATSALPSSSSWPPSSPLTSTSLSPTTPLLPTSTDFTTAAYLQHLERDIHHFWASFPCPPPWRPRLLIEVNVSHLNPMVTGTVRTYLADKCNIRHVLSGSDLDFGHVQFGFPSKNSPGPGSSTGDHGTWEGQWCDQTCQVGLGCALVLLVVVAVVGVLISLNRRRPGPKMTGTGPSRQPLRLSSSTSEAINCAEFCNLEVGSLGSALGLKLAKCSQIPGEDDFIFPPFRHRGLPQPPTGCSPSCDLKWNCPICSSCHPLMRMSPPEVYHPRSFSAVYESIDDEDELNKSLQQNQQNALQPGYVTPFISEANEIFSSNLPCHVPPSLLSPWRHIAETRFDHRDRPDAVFTTGVPRYFQLEHDCALSCHYRASPHTCSDLDTTTEFLNCSNNSDNRHSGHMSSAVDSRHLPFHSATPSHDHHLEFQVDDLTTTFKASSSSHETTSQQSDYKLGFQVPPFSSYLRSHARHGSSSLSPTLPPSEDSHNDPEDTDQCTWRLRGTPTCTLLPDIPGQYLCCRKQPTSTDRGPHTHRVSPTPTHHRTFRDLAAGPDLLKEASGQGKRQEPASVSDSSQGSLGKPVLALHSQYFAKSPLA